MTLTSTRDTQEQTPVTSGGLFRYVDAVLRPVNATVERYFLQVASWPALVVMLAVTAIPFVITIGLAFTNYDLVRYDQWRFIGLDNFEELANDRQTPIILVNTVVLVVFTTLIPTVFGLGLAVLMERSIRGMGLIRTLFLVPIMTAPVVVALTWRAMFNNDAGWINYFLGLVGLPTPVWLGDPLLAMPVVIIADAWTSIPFQAILLLAALLTVPSELKEAAGVDGAGRTRTFWHITLPWIRPVLFVVIVLRFMDAFRKFEGIQQLTRGGPGLASTPINLQIYNPGLFYSRVGYAAAWGLVMVAMIAASLVIVYLVRRRLA